MMVGLVVFNKISVISWQAVSLVEETKSTSKKNIELLQVLTLLTQMGTELTIIVQRQVLIGADCIGRLPNNHNNPHCKIHKV
jgi:hypothetical protein